MDAEKVGGSIALHRAQPGISFEQHLWKRRFELGAKAKLLAAVRRDKKRRLKRNDMPDLNHAAAALPYFDLFLTEGPLRDLVRSGNLKLDQEFSCTVVAEETEALAALRLLAANAN